MASLTRAFVPWRKLRQSSLQRRNQFGRNGCIELKWCTVHLRSGSVEEAYRLHVSGSVLGLASQGYSFFPTPTLFGCEKKKLGALNQKLRRKKKYQKESGRRRANAVKNSSNLGRGLPSTHWVSLPFLFFLNLDHRDFI